VLLEESNKLLRGGNRVKPFLAISEKAIAKRDGRETDLRLNGEPKRGEENLGREQNQHHSLKERKPYGVLLKNERR